MEPQVPGGARLQVGQGGLHQVIVRQGRAQGGQMEGPGVRQVGPEHLGGGFQGQGQPGDAGQVGQHRQGRFRFDAAVGIKNSAGSGQRVPPPGN